MLIANAAGKGAPHIRTRVHPSPCTADLFDRPPNPCSWGCGYRNIQMQVAHLLACRPEACPTLFGGTGAVPDICSLQARQHKEHAAANNDQHWMPHTPTLRSLALDP